MDGTKNVRRFHLSFLPLAHPALAVILVAWLRQRQSARGLTLAAVKE